MIPEGSIVNLYFQDADGYEEIVDAGIVGEDAIFRAIDKDLKTRRPKMNSYYKRAWIKDGKLFIDFGSHHEFYVGDIVSEYCDACEI